MSWEERITVDPNVLVASRLCEWTRISVEFVVDLLGRGWSVEQVLQEYDHLTAQDIQACLAYASDVLKSERVYLVSAFVTGCADAADRKRKYFGHGDPHVAATRHDVLSV